MKQLNAQELKLLREILHKRMSDRSLLDIVNETQGKIQDQSVVKKIISALADEFSTNGFSAGSEEPNIYGLQVDDLISFFSRILTQSE